MKKNNKDNFEDLSDIDGLFTYDTANEIAVTMTTDHYAFPSYNDLIVLLSYMDDDVITHLHNKVIRYSRHCYEQNISRQFRYHLIRDDGTTLQFTNGEEGEMQGIIAIHKYQDTPYWRASINLRNQNKFYYWDTEKASNLFYTNKGTMSEIFNYIANTIVNVCLLSKKTDVIYNTILNPTKK